MIKGIGIDIVEISRIEKAINRGAGRFRDRVFTEKEISYCEARAHPFEHYAARFAAKEALSKSLGTGFSGGLRFLEIEVGNDESGRPYLVLHGKTKTVVRSEGIGAIHLSLSHTGKCSAAVVICESKG